MTAHENLRRFRGLMSLAAAGCLLASCGGDTFTISVTPPSRACDGSEFQFVDVALQVFSGEDPVALGAGVDPATDTGPLCFPRNGTATDIAIAGPEGTGPFRLRASLLDESGQIVADGEAQVPDLSGAVQVATTGFNRSNCVAAPGGSPRAFHEAVPLPNGDVLVLGGLRDSTGLADTVELYKNDTQTFVSVNVEGAFARVGFAAVRTSNESPFRIAIIGGSSTVPSLGLTSPGHPVVWPQPSGPALENEVWQLDSTELSFRKTGSLSGDPGFWVAKSSSDGSGNVVALAPGMQAPWSVATRPPGGFFGDVLALGGPLGDVVSVTRPGTLDTRPARFGATITPLDAEASSFLLWGGMINRSSTAEAEQDVGAVVVPGMPFQIVPVDPTLSAEPPAAVAFHAAAALGPNTVLVAGGASVGCPTGCLATDPYVQYGLEDTIHRIEVLRVGGGNIQSVQRLDAGDRVLFPVATAAPGGVIVTGGATRTGPPAGGTFVASAQLLRVTDNGTTATAAAVPGIPGLSIARYGHQVSVVSSASGDVSLLVTGGFTAPGTATGQAELLRLVEAPGTLSCPSQ